MIKRLLTVTVAALAGLLAFGVSAAHADGPGCWTPSAAWRRRTRPRSRCS